MPSHKSRRQYYIVKKVSLLFTHNINRKDKIYKVLKQQEDTWDKSLIRNNLEQTMQDFNENDPNYDSKVLATTTNHTTSDKDNI